MSDLFNKRKVVIYEIDPGASMNIGTMPNVTIGTMPNVTVASMPGMVVTSGDISITDGTIDVSKIKGRQQIDRMGTMSLDVNGLTPTYTGAPISMFDEDITTSYKIQTLNEAGGTDGVEIKMDFNEAIAFRNILLYFNLWSDNAVVTFYLDKSTNGTDWTNIDSQTCAGDSTLRTYSMFGGATTANHLRVRAYCSTSGGYYEVLSWVVST